MEEIAESIRETRLFETSLSSFYANFPAMWDRPIPVAGLSKAPITRSWLFDPSHSLLGSASLNPLDYVALPQILLFYDGDDPIQVKWAIDTDKTLEGNTTLILVKGSVKTQMALFHKPVFFDQGGVLSRRFLLQHVPSMITQEGRHLKIQEIGLP